MNKHEYWVSAYRKREGGKTILDDTRRAFRMIPNTWRYWSGDPHVIQQEGRTWVFAELYDRVLRKGVIGCTELTEQGCSPWEVVLNQPHHLSYPHLFIREDQIYMIPESYVANEIALYRAEDFPRGWKKESVLKRDFCAVDSTVFSAEDGCWILTLRFENGQEKLLLFSAEKDSLGELVECISVDDPNKRPGGHFFRWQDKWIRPAQDGTDSYGCALNFYEVEQISAEGYRESFFRKIKPEDVAVQFPGKPSGIHTYNFSEDYEVIDLKGYETDWLAYIMRPIWYVWRRVRKVFGHR